MTDTEYEFIPYTPVPDIEVTETWEETLRQYRMEHR